MIMGHCSCCAHTHECAPEKHIEKRKNQYSLNIGKWDFHFILVDKWNHHERSGVTFLP